MQTRALAHAVLLSTVACGPGTGTPGPQPAGRQDGIVLTTERTRYRAGEPIGLQVSNRGEAAYGFNPCLRTVEHRAGGEWRPVEEGARICTMELWLLKPSGSHSATIDTPGDLAPGEYRVVLGFSPEDADPPAVPPERVRVASEPFTIAP